ncbi:hypothetical protein BJX76DRAFT_359548 [Aspergillus varians]
MSVFSVRDGPFGQLCRLVLGPRVFPYPDEKEGFKNPAAEAPTPESGSSSSETNVDVEKAEQGPSPGYHTIQICLLTFSVYAGSVIITPAQPAFVEIFGVSAQVSSLVPSMYVLGYGIGPLIFSPLSEVPALGRNVPYFVSFLGFSQDPIWSHILGMRHTIGTSDDADFILLNRAKRLRKSTGIKHLQSESEIKQGNVHFFSMLGGYRTTPFLATPRDPSVAFINIYTGLIYGIFYSYFESFPIVYTQIHGYSEGIMGVIFLSIVVACFFGAGSYLALVYFHFEPYTMKNGIGSLEHRLLSGVVAGLIAPCGILIFAWTSREWINGVVPTIGIVLYMACVFVLTMSIFIYLPMSYPRYAASLIAANSFLRSAFAAGAIHFSQPLFNDLGIGRGCTVLAGLTFGCFFSIPIIWR